MSKTDELQAQIDDLGLRLKEIRRIKHQMCNELMGAIGHAHLLGQNDGLSDKALQRVERIRQHCRNLTDQAEELSTVCRVGDMDEG